jgi:hypothetical protein
VPSTSARSTTAPWPTVGERWPEPEQRVPPRRRPEQRDPGRQQLLPDANTTPPRGSRPWQDNFFSAPNLARDDFYNIATKVDHVFSDKTKMFVRYAQNKRTELRNTNATPRSAAGQTSVTRGSRTRSTRWPASRARDFSPARQISRWDLNRPYPQFGGITQWERNDGAIWLHAVEDGRAVGLAR